MTVFLGLKTIRPRLLLSALLVNSAGVILTLAGWGPKATVFFVASTALAIARLRMFERSRQQPKTRGVHRSFPFFICMAEPRTPIPGISPHQKRVTLQRNFRALQSPGLVRDHWVSSCRFSPSRFR